MVFEGVSYNQISDVDEYPLDSSDPVGIINGSYPHTMHDLIQTSKCNSTILESLQTH